MSNGPTPGRQTTTYGNSCTISQRTRHSQSLQDVLISTFQSKTPEWVVESQKEVKWMENENCPICNGKMELDEVSGVRYHVCRLCMIWHEIQGPWWASETRWNLGFFLSRANRGKQGMTETKSPCEHCTSSQCKHCLAFNDYRKRLLKTHMQDRKWWRGETWENSKVCRLKWDAECRARLSDTLFTLLC